MPTVECPHCGAGNDASDKYCSRCGGMLAGDGPAAPDPFVGKVIAGKYRISRLLGIGGMGKVYKAVQLILDKTVCIKVLHAGYAAEPKQMKRFLLEAKAASRLDHPNIVTIFDFGQIEDGSSYIAMEYLKGINLIDVIEKEFPVSTARICHVMMQVCGALTTAHRAAIIHRDLKPENIMLVERGGDKDFVKVLDFGIAQIQDITIRGETKLTAYGMVCGTPEYMSPEQARGLDIDPRSDIYALGVVMFQLAAGRMPFEDDTPMGVALKHCTLPPPQVTDINPDTMASPALQAIIMRCLEKDRDRRPSSCEHLRDLLKRALEGASPESLLFDNPDDMPPLPDLDKLSREIEDDRPADAHGNRDVREVISRSAAEVRARSLAAAPGVVPPGNGAAAPVAPAAPVASRAAPDIDQAISAAVYSKSDQPAVAVAPPSAVHDNLGESPRGMLNVGIALGVIVALGTAAYLGLARAPAPAVAPPPLVAAPPPAPATPTAAALDPATARLYAENHYRDGDKAFIEKRYSDAAAAYQRAVEYDPNMAKAFKKLGMTFMTEKRMDDARKAFRSYVELDPSAPDASAIRSMIRELEAAKGNP